MTNTPSPDEDRELRHFFVDGERLETDLLELTGMQILAKTRYGFSGNLGLVLEGGSDGNSADFWLTPSTSVWIKGGERFSSIPRATWGG